MREGMGESRALAGLLLLPAGRRTGVRVDCRVAEYRVPSCRAAECRGAENRMPIPSAKCRVPSAECLPSAECRRRTPSAAVWSADANGDVRRGGQWRCAILMTRAMAMAMAVATAMRDADADGDARR